MIVTLSIWDILIIFLVEMILLGNLEWFIFLKICDKLEKYLKNIVEKEKK